LDGGTRSFCSCAAHALDAAGGHQRRGVNSLPTPQHHRGDRLGYRIWPGSLRSRSTGSSVSGARRCYGPGFGCHRHSRHYRVARSRAAAATG
jgi:hypothetical protein